MKVEKGKAVGLFEFESAEADIVIMADQQEADSAFLSSVEGIVLERRWHREDRCTKNDRA